MKPLLSDKYIQFSTISLVDNKNVISDDSELAKTFNSYFEKTVIEFGIKHTKVLIRIPTLDPWIMSIWLAINKYKNHPNINMIYENESFESSFNFKVQASQI